MIPTLSIRQPWAWLIVNGHKDIENRYWKTYLRGRFLVHAGTTMARSDYDETREALQAAGICPPDLPAFEDLERGGIVGLSHIVDCVDLSASPWYIPGNYGFVLERSRPLPFLPWKGRLKFFLVPESEVRL